MHGLSNQQEFKCNFLGGDHSKQMLQEDVHAFYVLVMFLLGELEVQMCRVQFDVTPILAECL
jgi:hypothetical protein